MTFARGNGWAWVMIGGYGLSIKDTTRHPMLFSERNGYVKFLRLGRWLVKCFGRMGPG